MKDFPGRKERKENSGSREDAGETEWSDSPLAWEEGESGNRIGTVFGVGG